MTALHTAEYRRLMDALAQARRDAQLSQYDLADKLGVDQSFISKYEAGRRRLDVIEFLRIVHAIGVDPKTIFEALQGEYGRFETPRLRRAVALVGDKAE
jgi:transcriptional regulator with XRE-family HTH domain